MQVLWKFKLYADVNLTVNEIYLLQCKKKNTKIMIRDLGSRSIFEVLKWHLKVELIRAGDKLLKRRRCGAKSEWCDGLHAVKKCYFSN